MLFDLIPITQFKLFCETDPFSQILSCVCVLSCQSSKVLSFGGYNSLVSLTSDIA